MTDLDLERFAAGDWVARPSALDLLSQERAANTYASIVRNALADNGAATRSHGRYSR